MEELGPILVGVYIAGFVWFAVESNLGNGVVNKLVEALGPKTLQQKTTFLLMVVYVAIGLAFVLRVFSA